MQLGFDLVYTDPNTHEVVPWSVPTTELLHEIKGAPWKVVDIETTGLNPASQEQKFTSKELRRGVDPRLRLRVLSVLFIRNGVKRVVAFDFDQLNEVERVAVCGASLKHALIAHNAGFDGYWVRLRSKVRPSLVLDTMLLARVLAADHPIVMAKLCGNENVLPEIREAAEMMFMQGKSGWALSHLAVGRLGRILPKGLQGPKNWAQPFLAQDSYDYASGDVLVTFDLLLNLFGITEAEVLANPQRLLTRYAELKTRFKALAIIEPQVLDVIEMREHGMLWSSEEAETYIAGQWDKVSAAARKMVELEPSLAPFEKAMASPSSGVTADLKIAIGNAFTARGLVLDLTDSTSAFKIGEKDLRRVKAAITPEAKELFETWVAMNRNKKAGNMAKDFTAYAKRSGDDKLHPNTGHGPVTGRLSSSEPNCQQMPRDQGFRNCVRAPVGYKIMADDYSALDMRVGGALAIRAQRQILEAYMGDHPVDLDVLRCIERVFEGKLTLEEIREEDARAAKDFKDWKDKLEAETEAGGNSRKQYWEAYRKKARTQLLAGFQRCLKEVRIRADEAGTADWGSLRDAFNIKGMDIHSWTALGMVGKDPKALFGGMSDVDVAIALKAAKKELGDNRQTGKVGNLSLLYAMKTKGLMDAAAKNYNIHWTFEEADKVRNDWLATYIEIDLWHKWTELTPFDTVYVPDPEKGNRFVKKAVYASRTLGDRLIYAFGLNAALSYEDQSTGADILGRVMSVLREEHPAIFDATINQVHDEAVFMFPDEKVEEYTKIVDRVMTECAEHFLMPFGIKGECSPAIGQVWVKD
jgi:hypothetical protein